MKSYYMHTDAGHGWLAVKRQELEKLGILDKISVYSYQKGGTVYLEEDCDLSVFLNALGLSWQEFTAKNTIKKSYKDRSKVRSYQDFKA